MAQEEEQHDCRSRGFGQQLYEETLYVNGNGLMTDLRPDFFLLTTWTEEGESERWMDGFYSARRH
jgi:hypothetical protein